MATIFPSLLKSDLVSVKSPLLKVYLEEIEKELSQYLAAQLPEEPKNLYDPIRYTLNNGGKRFRPLLACLAYSLYKEDYKKVMPAALAMELFHNFSLIHDDIMDNAPKRRAKDTVHKKWNANIAILSGDALLVKSYELLNSIDIKQTKEVIDAFSKTALLVCEGQQMDMDFEKEHDVSIHDYMRMIELKTAVLLAASLKIGALAADVPLSEANLLYDYGKMIGLAFQLKDDILDVYADEKEFGKAKGGDIIANKKTYLLLKTFELLQDDEASIEELDKLLNGVYDEPEVKVKAVTAIYDKVGIKELAEKEVSVYYSKAIGFIDKLSINEQGKEMLKQFSESVMNRTI